MIDSEEKERVETAEAEALKRAISKLDIDGIFLVSSQSSISESFSPAEFVPENYLSQGFMKRVSSGHDDEGQYGFKIAVGMRLVPTDYSEEGQAGTEKHTCMEVRAEFLSVYKSSEALLEDEQDAFHRHNVIYHVWPYWREFVQQIGWRMGAPYLSAPMLKNSPRLN